MVYVPSSSTGTATMTSTKTEQISPSTSQTSFLFRQSSVNSIPKSISNSKSNSHDIRQSKVQKDCKDHPSKLVRLSSKRSSSSNSDVEVSDKSKCSETKEALCRRMGALFLRHKVEQLADDVEKMQQGRNSRCPIQKRMQRKNKEEFGRIGSSDNLSVANTARTSTDLTTLTSGSEEKIAQYTDESDIKRQKWKGTSCKKSKFSPCVTSCKQQKSAQSTAQAARKDSNLPPSNFPSTTVTRIIIADASLLIYSLRTVHEYLKAGDCQIIVPCEALSTLDVLKKGEHTLNWAARRATRFLDERFSVLDDGEDDAENLQFSTKDAKESFNLRAGLFPQGLHQRLNILKNQVKDEEKFFEKFDISLQSLKKAPITATKTFDCALYFLEKYQNNEQISCALAIALPPPHLDFEQEALHAESNSDLRFAERADGNVILHWSKECGLMTFETMPLPRLIVAPTAASWLTVASTIPNSVV